MTIGSTNNILGNAKLTLKLGLYNMENLFLLLGHEVPEHYLQLSEAQWQKLTTSVYESKPLVKCRQIAAIITEENPDILMVCETGGLESLNNFNKLFLASRYNVALMEGNSDRNIDVGFLIKKDVSFFFDIASNRLRPLNYLYPHEATSKKTGYPIKAQSQFFSRDCSELRLFTESKGNPFLIILLTHLKSRLDPERIDPGGLERRGAELRTCLDIYKELKLKHAGTPIIFCGDMNGYAGKPNTDTEFLPIYAETDLEDVLELAHVSIDQRSTFYQIKNGAKADGRQIDYCFVCKELKDKLVKNETYVYRYRDELGSVYGLPKSMDDKLKMPSDHYPLFFKLDKLEY